MRLIKFEVQIAFFFFLKYRNAWKVFCFVFLFEKEGPIFTYSLWQTIMKTFTYLDYLEN